MLFFIGTGSTARNVPVREDVRVKKDHDYHTHVSFAKEKTLVPTFHNVLDLIDSSGSGEDETEGSVDISSSSGEGSTSFETVEQSGYIGENVKGSTEKEDNLGVEISASGSGYDDEKDSTDKKSKGYVDEEETTTQPTGRESGNLSNCTAKMDKLLPVAPYVKIPHSSVTPTALTFTEKVTEGDKRFPITKKVATDADTFEGTSKVKSSSMFVKKPTGFLRVLQKIRRELDELLEWKEAHVKKLYEVARQIGKVFNQEIFFTPRGQADEKKHLRQDGRRKRSNDDEIDDTGLSKEILRKIESK